MSSLTGLPSSAQAFSPKQHILSAIASQVSAGSISSADQTALDSAVSDIDSNLTTQRSSTSKASQPPDPSQIKTKIDSLIDDEVTNGKLTSDQASTLKQVFSQSGPGQDQGPSGAGGPGGAGGPPPGPPPAGGAASGGSGSTLSSLLDDTSTSSDDSTTSSTASTSNLLASFLKNLQASQGSTSGYGAGGTSASSSQANALLYDFNT